MGTKMNFQEPSFCQGTVSPKRRRSAKQTVEKRRVNYKKGINAEENRKHRSSIGTDLRRTKKEKVLTQHRSVSKNTLGRRRGKYTGSAREKLIQFYTDYNPSKVEFVDKTLEKYASKEEALFKNLAKRYNVQTAVFGIAGGAFASYAGGTHATFGSLATPKDKAQSSGFGLGSYQQHNNKRRTTITSLKTHADDLRASSDRDSDDDMECD
ncbi:hypothetical protein ACHAW5_006229 [Stephanodiscus triporus]|uniref:Uncharacterized protein n=1 Tax=Stephanodiscus triporus TaxID=2934178 RepID=A0ABD3NLM6_9STRA